MKVFISWSGFGGPSEQVANLFKEWLKCVIQACDPFVSTQDIQKGTMWLSVINEHLSETGFGILCLTQENKERPWILFEAGALIKGLSTNRVCPFLINLAPTDIGPPLSQLNMTTGTKEDVRLLVQTINSLLGEGKLPEKILDIVFERNWPDFEQRFSAIVANIPHNDEQTNSRDDKDILNEILQSVRGLTRRIGVLENTNRTSAVDANAALQRNVTTRLIEIENIRTRPLRTFYQTCLAQGMNKDQAIEKALFSNWGAIKPHEIISLADEVFGDQ